MSVADHGELPETARLPTAAGAIVSLSRAGTTSALRTLSRPLVSVGYDALAPMEPIGSTLLSSRAFMSATLRFGNADQTSAAAPATCGVAIDVPELQPYVLPGCVLHTLSPGAARSTLVAPQLVNEA